MFACLSGCDTQVKGHVVGNLSVGNDHGRPLSILTVLIPFIGCHRTPNSPAVARRDHPRVIGQDLRGGELAGPGQRPGVEQEDQPGSPEPRPYGPGALSPL